MQNDDPIGNILQFGAHRSTTTGTTCWLHRASLLRRVVPAVHTPDGIRALSKGKPVPPEGVERYLESKFGDGLDATRNAMNALARSFPPAELADQAYAFYEKFRPDVPAGVKGWGAAGVLDLSRIVRLRG